MYRNKVFNLGPNEIIILRVLNRESNRYFGSYGIGTELGTYFISKNGKQYSVSGHSDTNKAKNTFIQLGRKKLVSVKELYPGSRLVLQAKITSLGCKVLHEYELIKGKYEK